MEKVTAHNPTEKEMATERKEEKIHHAELSKLEAREQNAAATLASKTGGGGGSYTAQGATGQATGGHQMSALPGHGTGAPAGGHVTEGTMKSHPIGTATGTGRPTTAHNTHVGGGGGAGTGYSTGGGYSG